MGWMLGWRWMSVREDYGIQSGGINHQSYHIKTDWADGNWMWNVGPKSNSGSCMPAGGICIGIRGWGAGGGAGGAGGVLLKEHSGIQGRATVGAMAAAARMNTK